MIFLFFLEKNISLSVMRWVKVHFKFSLFQLSSWNSCSLWYVLQSIVACCIITWDWLSPQLADLNTVPSWPIFFSVDSLFLLFFSLFFLKHIKAMGNILSCFLRISSWLGDKLKMDWHLGRNMITWYLLHGTLKCLLR